VISVLRDCRLTTMRSVQDGGTPPGTDESYYSLRGIEQVLPEDAVPPEALADKMFARAGHKLEDDAAQGVTDS
jgi:hypothetical protein